LDKNNQPQPREVPGELYIGGDGLASGYLNRPALTQKKFISNPFLPGERMFKTGDFARWQPDGNIEFMGRIDSQVKIRGHRIELGEIESQLLTYEQIKQALVVPGENKKGNKYLCAYFVSDVPLSASELREYLLKELPGYMIPSYFVPLEKIPVNPHGKIDRKALPLPERFGCREEYAAPRDKLEQVFADIFQEFYGIDKVGIRDNFFDLGATSLDLIRLNSKVKKMLGREISIILFFEHPTIAALSGYLQGKENQPGKNEIDVDGIIDKGKSKLRQLKKKVNGAGGPE
jgi:acyl carrier protein